MLAGGRYCSNFLMSKFVILNPLLYNICNLSETSVTGRMKPTDSGDALTLSVVALTLARCTPGLDIQVL